jgi:hypothetical protein
MRISTIGLLSLICLASGALSQTRPAPGVSRGRLAGQVTTSAPGAALHPDVPLLPSSPLLARHAASPRVDLPAGVASPQIFVVTTNKDTGAGSLRDAIHKANLNPGADVIDFAIGSGVQTIRPATPYEVITSPVFIDGTTQPGYSGKPLIELDGTLLAAFTFDNGLEIDAPGTTIKGLVINRFAGGIVIDPSGGVIVQGNYIGTDPTGLLPLPNLVVGVQLFGSGNLIGGTTQGAGNVISSNPRNIEDDESGGTGYGGNVFQGNIIGLDATGTKLLQGSTAGSSPVGIFVYEATNDTIGGTATGAGNIISANVDGIYIGNSTGTSQCLVQGNIIGLDATGKANMGNTRSGVTLWGRSGNLVGGLTPSARNVIGWNAEAGIRIRGGTSGNLIQGNLIGTDITGRTSAPNGDGISVKVASGNLIGGTDPGSHNIVSGNANTGITLDTSSSGTTIQGNLVGVVPVNGTYVPLANAKEGIVIRNSPRNTVGGTTAPACNTIGGNSLEGIYITDDSATGNVVAENGIGTDSSGTMVLGNKFDGVLINASANRIGGSQGVDGNVIRNNGGAGVYVLKGTGNLFGHNSIGANKSLGIDLDPPGPNPNDSLDTDGGPNLRQNYPVIDSVQRQAATTVVYGRLNSVPNSSYTIEFFENSSADPSGYGQGEFSLGTTPVTTDGAGNGAFAMTVQFPLAPGKVVTSTATDASGNTSEFSRTPKPITITKPAPGELFLTFDPDTIRWSTNAPINQVGIAYSVDDGKTFALIAAPIPAGQGLYRWTIPQGTLTKKAKVVVYNTADPTQTDTTSEFKIKGVELTRDSSGDYVRYEVYRHGWSFANGAANMWPKSWWSQFDYQFGIDPYTYLPYKAPISLVGTSSHFPDWPLMVSAVTVTSCYFGPTTYNPLAVAFWFVTGGGYQGSCFGLATSSFLAFDNVPQFLALFPDVAGGAFTDLHNLGVTPVRAEEINREWEEQDAAVHESVKKSQSATTPLQTIEDIKAMFASETRDDRVLTLVNESPSGAHGINPWRITRDPVIPDLVHIDVYDNNFPGDTTYSVDVNTSTNTWSYLGQPGWGGKTGLYLSDPVSTYVNAASLYFGGTNPAPATARSFQASSGLVRIYTPTDAAIRIADSSGNSVGFADSAVYNTLPQAFPIVPITGGFSRPIGYELPAGGDYVVVVKNFADSSARVSVFGDSTVFSYARSHALSSQSDHLRFRQGLDVANYDLAVKLVNLETIMAEPDNQKVVSLNNAALGTNDSLHVEEAGGQNLNLVNMGDSLRFDLSLHRASASGDPSFQHANVTVPARSAARIVPAWNPALVGQVKLLIDHGITGTYTDSIILSNQLSGWITDSTLNNPVCTAFGWQTAPLVVKDALGGSIVIWQDQRKGFDINYTDFDIYAQRLNAQGYPQWTLDGAPVEVDSVNDLYPRAVSDGRGGAIIIWWTTSSSLKATPYTIRAQRIDSTGTVKWAPGGVVVDTYPNNTSEFYGLVSDAHGGIIIVSESMPGAPAYVFAQRVDSSGAVRWGTHGIALAPGVNSGQAGVSAAADGAGGVVATWSDNRYGGTDSAGAIFMQRVDASGTLLWGQSGVKITNHSSASVSILAHGSSDYFVVWGLNPGVSGPVNDNVFVQKLNAGGVAQWPVSGVHVTGNTGAGQARPDLCDDRRGGAIITWEEPRNGSLNVYAQRIDSSGNQQWLSTGIPLLTGEIGTDRLPEIVENGKGGAFVIWQDSRQTAVDPTNYDIYVQGIGANGSLAYQANGMPVTIAPKPQAFSNYFKRGIALTDTNGIAVVAWEDGRDNNQTKTDYGQIYAQRIVFPPGLLTGISPGGGPAPESFRLDQNYPNPFNPTTTIGYGLPAWEHVSLEVFNILGQRTATLVDEDQPPGDHKVVFNGTRFASGVYFYRLRAGSFIQTHKLVILK